MSLHIRGVAREQRIQGTVEISDLVSLEDKVSVDVCGTHDRGRHRVELEPDGRFRGHGRGQLDRIPVDTRPLKRHPIALRILDMSPGADHVAG